MAIDLILTYLGYFIAWVAVAIIIALLVYKLVRRAQGKLTIKFTEEVLNSRFGSKVHKATFVMNLKQQFRYFYPASRGIFYQVEKWNTLDKIQHYTVKNEQDYERMKHFLDYFGCPFHEKTKGIKHKIWVNTTKLPDDFMTDYTSKVEGYMVLE